MGDTKSLNASGRKKKYRLISILTTKIVNVVKGPANVFEVSPPARVTGLVVNAPPASQFTH
jgi:hypothetical protein